MILTDYIEFEHETHQYTNIDGEIVPSVTSYIKQYCKPFDADYWAQKKADEEGISKEEMLQKWVDKRDLGTAIHESLSDYIKSKGSTELHENITDWIKDQLDNLIQDDNLTLYSEQIIYSRELNLAGTVDLIIKDNQLNQYMIIDFKTNKTLTSYYHTKNAEGVLIPCSKMYYPYDSYFDTNLNHYKVQLLKYSEILVKNGYICNPNFSQIWHITKSKIYNDLWKPYEKKIKL